MAVKTVQVVINGVTTNLSFNSTTGMYEGSITAPSNSSYNVNSGHYYPVTIKAIDDAGNEITVSDSDQTLGESLKLLVKETTAPVITITSPAEDARLTNNKPTITWKVTDDDSGVDPDTISISFDDGSNITDGITKTKITGGYQCSYTMPEALSDGSHTIKCDASDFDGNSSVQRTLNVIVDTVPPTLSVTSPINNLFTNKSSVALTGTTNDLTSGPVTLQYVLNGGSPVDVEVGTDGSFGTNITISSGANTLVITATDSAGKSSSVTRTLTLDTEAPVISNIIISPNPVSTGEVLSISVSVTD